MYRQERNSWTIVLWFTNKAMIDMTIQWNDLHLVCMLMIKV